jgi:hypothetical protein
MPSEKIASLCTIHLMKHLFSQFVNDIRKFKDEETNLNGKDDSMNKSDVKFTAIQLFDELGKLFDKELKQTLLNPKGKKHAEEQDNPDKKI